MVGYHRYEGVAATTILAELYAALRLYVNFFQPSFKLAEKRRDGARVIKRHHAPATPCQRLLDDPRTTGAVRDRLRSEEHTSELQSLMRISYAVFCLKKKKTNQ